MKNKYNYDAMGNRIVEFKLPDTFKQVISLDDARKLCAENYEKFKDVNTIYTTGVPFVKIGTYSIFDIQVRYFRLFNQKPQWGFYVECGGGTIECGFKSFDEALEAAIVEADRKIKEIEDKYPDLKD